MKITSASAYSRPDTGMQLAIFRNLNITLKLHIPCLITIHFKGSVLLCTCPNGITKVYVEVHSIAGSFAVCAFVSFAYMHVNWPFKKIWGLILHRCLGNSRDFQRSVILRAGSCDCGMLFQNSISWEETCPATLECTWTLQARGTPRAARR